jgi:acyl-CoA thioester hydrolase
MSEENARPARDFAYALTVQATLRDTDGLGHVNNGVYLSWMEEVRTRYVYDRRGLRDLSQIDFILASAKLDFRSPVRLHEYVDLRCAPVRVGRSSWELAYEGRARSDGRLVLEARSVQVHYDYSLGAPAPIPDGWRALLEADKIGGV